MSNAHIPAPELDLKDATPVSRAFGDVYFSRHGGIAETEHVFLRGNNLFARWQRMGAVRPARFAIDAWYLDGFAPAKNPDMWREEIFEGLGRLSADGATAATFSAASVVRNGLASAGFTVNKTQGFGHKRDMTVAARGEGDAASIFRIAELGFGSGLNFLTTLKRFREHAPAYATLHYHAVEKFPFTLQQLREVLALQPELASEAAELIAQYPLRLPGPHRLCFGRVTLDLWFGEVGEWLAALEAAQNTAANPAGAVVIGAGIAGASIARALAERGVTVTVLERGKVASGASGNKAGVLYPPLSKTWSPSTAFYFSAYAHMLRMLTQYNTAHASPGMLRLPRHAEELAQLRELNATLGLDENIVHWDEARGGAYFPQGTWLAPRELTRAMLQHANIFVRENTSVESLSERRVTLTTGETLEADAIIIAAASDAASLAAHYGITLGAVGGQVSEIAAANVAHQRSILCRKGYLIPQGDTYLLGATYHRDDLLSVTDARHAENLAELAELISNTNAKVIGGRSAIRATTPDRVPVIGQLAPGVYISSGHGSRGLLSAALGAEMLASAMMGEGPCVMPAQQAALDPLRFSRRLAVRAS